jgi:CheY-like chemotaxis protein
MRVSFRNSPHGSQFLKQAIFVQEVRAVSDTSVILVVEDREDDILLIRRAFEWASVPNPTQVVRDGEAIAYLIGEGKYANRDEYPLPILVLLDLKLPRKDGFEVLSWIRRQPGIRSIPVVVLTSSNQIRDVNRAYQLGANSFFVKELDFQGTVDLSKLLQSYWLKKTLTPEASRPERKSRASPQRSDN